MRLRFLIVGGVVAVVAGVVWGFRTWRWEIVSNPYLNGSPCALMGERLPPEEFLDPVPAQKVYDYSEPLGCAISWQRYDVVSYLVENGYDVNWEEEDQGPMVLAFLSVQRRGVREEALQIAELLEDHGLDYCPPIALRSTGELGTPLEYADDIGRPVFRELYDEMGWSC